MIEGFILNAVVAGLGIALITAPLGCVVVWRRMAYFGDTLAHSALLGAVLALSLQWLPAIGMILIAILLTSALYWLERHRELTTDTLLGILSHGALATGIILLSVFQQDLPAIDILGLLFGDILSVNQGELITIAIVATFVLALTLRYWRMVVSVATHEELARIDGVDTAKVRYFFMFAMAVVIAVSVKLVGVLLVTAMLIIPAASARLVSRSPQQMILNAMIVSVLSVMIGLSSSLQWDLPTGPAIVMASVVLFFTARLIAAVR